MKIKSHGKKKKISKNRNGNSIEKDAGRKQIK